MRYLIIIAVTGFTACAPFPELDGTISEAARNAPFPRLINIDTIAAPAPSEAPDLANLDARLARLNARAEALRGPVIDPGTTNRLDTGVR